MIMNRMYTAQEMREQAMWFRYRAAWSPNNAFYIAEKMLLQAADAEEQLEKVKKIAQRKNWKEDNDGK